MDRSSNYADTRRVLTLFAAALITIGTALSCTGRDNEPGEDELSIYAYAEFPTILLDEISMYFDSTYEIRIDIERFNDPVDLIDRLQTERQEPHADVVIGLDALSVFSLVESELFVSYRPDGVELVNQSLLVDSDYRVVPVAYGGVGLVYDSRSIPDPPRSFNAMLDPRFESKIILLDPDTSLAGRHFMLFMILELGEGELRRYLKKLRPNIAEVVPTWGEGFDRITHDDAAVVPGYLKLPVGAGAERYGTVALHGKTYARIEIAGITATAPHPVNARRFIDFVVSKEFQTAIAEDHALYPAGRGVQASSASAAELEIDPEEVRMVKIGEASAVQHIDRWIDTWKQALSKTADQPEGD